MSTSRGDCSTVKESRSTGSRKYYLKYCRSGNGLSPAQIIGDSSKDSYRQVIATGITLPQPATFTPKYVATVCGGVTQDGATRNDPTPGSLTLTFVQGCNATISSMLEDALCEKTLYISNGGCLCPENPCDGDFTSMSVFCLQDGGTASTITDDTFAGAPAREEFSITYVMPSRHEIGKLEFVDVIPSLPIAFTGVSGTAYYGDRSCPNASRTGSCGCGKKGCANGTEHKAILGRNGTSNILAYLDSNGVWQTLLIPFSTLARNYRSLLNCGGRLVAYFTGTGGVSGYSVFNIDKNSNVLAPTDYTTTTHGTPAISKQACCGGKIINVGSGGIVHSFDPNTGVFTNLFRAPGLNPSTIPTSIDCCGDCIAIGYQTASLFNNGSAFWYSTNGGASWGNANGEMNNTPSFPAVYPTAISLNGCSGKADIGMSNGVIYRTGDGFSTYTQIGNVGGYVSAIEYPTAEEGYIASAAGLHMIIGDNICPFNKSWRTKDNAKVPSFAGATNLTPISISTPSVTGHGSGTVNINDLIVATSTATTICCASVKYAVI